MDIMIEELDGGLWVAATKYGQLYGLEVDPGREAVRWGSIYWAKITRIDRTMDAAFVSLDGQYEGFLANKDVRVKSADGTTTLAAGADYTVDADLGLLQIVEGGEIKEATEVKVGYTAAEANWERIKSGNGADLKGALQLIADNAHGANRDWFFPSVSLSPTGELPLIQDGTDYSQFGFDVEVLKPDNGEAVYVDGRSALIP